MKILRKFLIAVVAAIMIISPFAANADVRIHILPGQTCWSYTGRETRFFGRFGSWGSITYNAYAEFRDEYGQTYIVPAKLTAINVEGVKLGQAPFEMGRAPDGSYPTPEGGDADMVFVLKFENPGGVLKTVHFHICCTSEAPAMHDPKNN
jgi:hypothetical protein